jgi:hypothetical protein
LSSPARHSSQSRSWRTIAIVLVVVVVAGGAVFFLLNKGGKKTPDGFDPSNPSSPISLPSNVTPVKFHMRASKSVTVVTKKPDAANVKTAVDDIRGTLGNLYTIAFIDPQTWQSGNYDNVFGFFEQGKISDAAKRDENILTLGAKAGDTYKDIEPHFAALKVDMLTDKGGQPYTAAATADFTANATKKDGKATTIKSHATYILQRGEGGWIIVAYKADRQDGGGAKTSGGSN